MVELLADVDPGMPSKQWFVKKGTPALKYGNGTGPNNFMKDRTIAQGSLPIRWIGSLQGFYIMLGTKPQWTNVNDVSLPPVDEEEEAGDAPDWSGDPSEASYETSTQGTGDE